MSDHDKAALKAQISEAEGLSAMAAAKAEAIQRAIALVASAETKVEWTPKSHSNIKETYKLAGKPYADMSDDEEEIANTASTDLDGKREELLEDLQSAYSAASAKASAARSRVASLKAQL
ncbi:Uncharacterised protein [Streptococcus criceti]|uniref:DUF5082 domain-containing protein n=1 Tax=Streptococcus criceti HS-6 TaxID=873449 RepID=G5JNV9_STRCG|nr:hypothetical protein [Streptococcus criceti]EHI74179.1 hypothetical protein STRCR_1490 [Streptococcus criceti HS-6]SUN43271.1 Uncharacterised protein [Streptococcus criceti]